MGRQINFYHNKIDDLELVEVIKRKMDIWSLPRVFAMSEFIPKSLGNYVDVSEEVFPQSYLNKLSGHIKKGYNSDDYRVWSPDNSSLEWTKTRFDICIDKPGAEFTAWEGRFYMESKSEQYEEGGHYKKESVPELQKLFSLVCREIEKSSPYITTGKRKFYIGKNMAEMVSEGKIFVYYKFIKNPNCKIL